MNNRAMFAAAAITVLLAACGGPSSPAGGGVTSIAGAVQGWSKGAATVTFVPAGGPALASAALGADGTFNLALPDAQAVGPYLEPLDAAVGTLALYGAPGGCRFDNLQLSGGGSALLLTNLGITKNGTSLSTITGGTVISGGNATVNFDLRGWLYSRGAVSVSGTASCSDTSNNVTTAFTSTVFTSTVALDLAPGWNVAALKGSRVSSIGQDGSATQTTNLTLSTIPDGRSVWSTPDGLVQISGR